MQEIKKRNRNPKNPWKLSTLNMRCLHHMLIEPEFKEVAYRKKPQIYSHLLLGVEYHTNFRANQLCFALKCHNAEDSQTKKPAQEMCRLKVTKLISL